MRLTRRQVLAGAASGALGAAGLYELVDRLTAAPARRAARARLPTEQHLLDGLEILVDDGVEVVVPPLHHRLVTARVAARDLPAAKRALEARLAELDRRYEPTPAGLGVTVGWGLPYFRRLGAEEALPVDLRASRTKARPVRALVDAIRFPSDPHDVVLERNDVAVLLRSDRLEHLDDAERALFEELHVLERTSVRKGFVGGGFHGGPGLPKQMAQAAGIPGADLIPDGAELFLGFTSTQRAGLGPGRIANLETLGYVELGRHVRVFRGGTHMHVSHVSEDVEAWYLNFDFGERVSTAFRPGLRVQLGAQTVRQAPAGVASPRAVRRDFDRSGTIGHSASIQTSSRLAADIVGSDGVVYRKGTAVPQRADFNTLDNPFAWSADPARDGMRDAPAAGVHFVVFNPSADDFHRNRLAMDGVLPDGTRLAFAPRDRGQGINSVLRTTHRQNFLVPPRAHRSFPLVR